MRRCRKAIESQFPGALLSGVGPHDVEQLRVALYCAERGVEEMINQANDPRWTKTLPDDLAGSITSTLQTLATALRDETDARSRWTPSHAKLNASATASTTRRPAQRRPMMHRSFRTRRHWQL